MIKFNVLTIITDIDSLFFMFSGFVKHCRRNSVRFFSSQQGSHLPPFGMLIT